MLSTTSKEEVCQSVLDFVTESKFPDAEDIVASEFPVSALPEELQRVAEARQQVEVRHTTVPSMPSTNR
jgi:hypothetical protein